jgi:predicted PurR-regulated permease PerM
MSTTWSRWLFGVWAVVAAVWLVVATILLVQTWPDALSDRAGMLGDAGDESLFAQAGAGTGSAVAQHMRRFLLVAIVPPGFLLVIVCIGLWIAGLPFPSFRRGSRDKGSLPRA